MKRLPVETCISPVRHSIDANRNNRDLVAVQPRGHLAEKLGNRNNPIRAPHKSVDTFSLRIAHSLLIDRRFGPLA